MKPNIKSTVASIVLAGMFMLGMASSAQANSAPCSNATLSGEYAATLTGTVNGLPFAALDLATADGAGNITATGTIVSNGVVIPTSFTATYTVNPDCSGSFTSSTGTTENIVIKHDGSEVEIIVTGTPLGPATVAGLAKRLTD